MMTEIEFQSMSAGFQAAELPARPIFPTSPTQDQEIKPEHKEETQNAQNDLQEKYDRLNVRHKHIVEERDSLSKQVQDLRRKVEVSTYHKHDTVEEIKLLNKLIDEEHSLRDEAREKGTLPANYDAFTRHDRFVSAFLSIVSRDN